MIKGATIILSDEYINELTRHKDNLEQQILLEDIPDKKARIQSRFDIMSKKLDEALEFQDVVDEIVNLEIPNMAVVKTMTGLVLPLANIKVL